MKSKINITYDCGFFVRFAVSPLIKKCINATLEAEGIRVPCEINVLVTNNMGIQAINKASRNIDKPTDVLSFPMFQLVAGEQPECWDAYLDPETGLCPLGDMAISFERAEMQAKEYGHGTRREIGYLTIHSVLHLLGYDHMDEGEEKALMRSREESIAAQISGLER